MEKAEKKSNAQLAREIEVALPKELSRECQIEIVRKYVQDNLVSVGMCADWALHDKKDGNPHAHIMLTMRGIKPDGSWADICNEYLSLEQQIDHRSYKRQELDLETTIHEGYRARKMESQI